jgi:hypothetical protein
MKVIPFTTETFLAEKILRMAAIENGNYADEDHSKFYEFMNTVRDGLSHETRVHYSDTWHRVRRLYKEFKK